MGKKLEKRGKILIKLIEYFLLQFTVSEYRDHVFIVNYEFFFTLHRRIHKHSSARGQYEANPVFWLATRAGKMGPLCPHRIARFELAQENNWISTNFVILLSKWRSSQYILNLSSWESGIFVQCWRRRRKKRQKTVKTKNYKRISWVCCATFTVGFFSRLSK